MICGNRHQKSPTQAWRQVWIAGFLGTFLLFVAGGCRTVRYDHPVNLKEPGWRTQLGQALWKPSQQADEIAGEILLASHADGRAFIQFIKTPLPFVEARLEPNSWEFHVALQNRTFSGRGRPPRRIGWFHLPAAMRDQPPPAPWSFQKQSDGSWMLSNAKSGETVSGYFNP